MTKTTIGALVFDGFEPLDLFGPMEMFGAADAYNLTLIGCTKGTVKSAYGLDVMATGDLNTGFDILFVPGGPGIKRDCIHDEALLDWTCRASDKADTTLSVCTGSALLAVAGVLDGRRATSNKQAWDWVTSLSDKVDWQRHARWVEDKEIVTSSGVSAGMDMALAVIAAQHGRALAEDVARGTEYIWNDDPSDDPFAPKPA